MIELHGTEGWEFLVPRVDGKDLVVRGAEASWFDDKETASGFDASTVLGCALPMRVGDFAKTMGSPIPRLDFHTQVRVWCPETNRQSTVYLIDVGPDKRVRREIDLSKRLFMSLGLPLSRGVVSVDYRILRYKEHLR